MNGPLIRPRRLRQSSLVRDMIRETRLHSSQLVLPLFVNKSVKGRKLVPSMPGVYETDVAELVKNAQRAFDDGVRRVLLFGVPPGKDPMGSGAYDPEGVVQEAVRALKHRFGKDLLIMTDACLCQYTDHGHCGVFQSPAAMGVDNDATLDLLEKIAVTHAAAGADVIAPSGMIDGMIGRMRAALDEEGFQETMLMSYAVKYASALYGPFRDAAHSAPSHGDRRTQQMDPANSKEALREALLDEVEGADILMVKPAISYLDIINQLATETTLPVAAYIVSGEYSMVKAAAEKGWIDEPTVTYEQHLSVARAGASIIITYAARDLAKWMADGKVG